MTTVVVSNNMLYHEAQIVSEWYVGQTEHLWDVREEETHSKVIIINNHSINIRTHKWQEIPRGRVLKRLEWRE